ncbi:MAG: hypothetical protein K6F37_09775, partial [Lachnospiraceae bacterium]|nr:hypothetical protein [Lachnospiraceae bacterium]
VKKRQEERRQRQLLEEHRRDMIAKRRALIFMVFCVLALCLSSFTMLYLNSQVTSRAKSVARLQSEYAKIKDDNDAKERNNSLSLNYYELKSKAEALGMAQVSGEQIVVFSLDEDDYMEQSKNIE